MSLQALADSLGVRVGFDLREPDGIRTCLRSRGYLGGLPGQERLEDAIIIDSGPRDGIRRRAREGILTGRDLFEIVASPGRSVQGRRFRAARLMARRTVDDVADLLSVSRGRISQHESGRSSLSDESAIRCSRDFGVDSRWLLDGTEHMNDSASPGSTFEPSALATLLCASEDQVWRWFFELQPRRIIRADLYEYENRAVFITTPEFFVAIDRPELAVQRTQQMRTSPEWMRNYEAVRWVVSWIWRSAQKESLIRSTADLSGFAIDKWLPQNKDEAQELSRDIPYLPLVFPFLSVDQLLPGLNRPKPDGARVTTLP